MKQWIYYIFGGLIVIILVQWLSMRRGVVIDVKKIEEAKKHIREANRIKPVRVIIAELNDILNSR